MVPLPDTAWMEMDISEACSGNTVPWHRVIDASSSWGTSTSMRYIPWSWHHDHGDRAGGWGSAGCADDTADELAQLATDVTTAAFESVSRITFSFVRA